MDIGIKPSCYVFPHACFGYNAHTQHNAHNEEHLLQHAIL